MIVVLSDYVACFVSSAGVGDEVAGRLLDDDGMPTDEIVFGRVTEILDGERD